MTKSYKNKLVNEDLKSILMQARATPNIKNSYIEGFRIDLIIPGSIFEKAGVQNGDIVTNINGNPLDDAGGAISLLNSLKELIFLILKLCVQVNLFHGS